MTGRKIFEMTEDSGRILELYGNENGDPEIYIDGAWGFTYVNGVCKITTYTVAPVADRNHERREVAARIIMTVPVIFALRDYLVGQCKSLEEKALSLSPEDIAILTGKKSAKKSSSHKKKKTKARRPKG